MGVRGAAEVDFSPAVPSVKIRRSNTFTLSEVEVDVTGCQHSEALVKRVEEALPVGADTGTRVRLVGELALGVQLGPSELRRRLRGGERMDVIDSTRTALDLEQLSRAPDVRGQFIRGLMKRPDESDSSNPRFDWGGSASGSRPAILTNPGDGRRRG